MLDATALPIGPDSEQPAVAWRADWRGRDAGDRGDWAVSRMDEEQRSRLVRHRTYMIEGVPQDYQGAASPIDRSQDEIMAGAALYAKYCETCHGRTGRGGGDAGRTLKPSPALKTYISRRPWAADEYLLWSVAEGGQKFGSTMPAFRPPSENQY